MSSLSLLNSSGVMPFLTLTAVFLFIGPVLFIGIATMWNFKQKISDELSARLSEVNSTFTVELVRNNNKLTTEIAKINSHDANYATEAQKILGRLSKPTIMTLVVLDP